MSRRVISVGSLLVALVALVVVLVNATLVDRRGPAVTDVTLSAPASGQADVALTLTAIQIQFSEPVVTASVERRFRISPNVDGALSWDGSTAVFTPSDKLPPDTAFTVSIEPGFEDLAGNASETGLDAFAFRTAGPPVVAGTAPTDGAVDVPVDAPLVLTFDRLMDTASVERAVEIEPEAAIRPTWSGQSLTLALDERLEFGQTYTVTIGATAADTGGSRIGTPFSMTFTTVRSGLRVARTLPAESTAGVSVRSAIAVVFDGPIDPETIEGAISVTPPVGGDVRIVPLPDDTVARGPDDPDPAGTVLLLEPAEPLAANTTYTVGLETMVARAGAPGQVADGRTWSFTTGAPTPSGHNHVAFLSARSGMRAVWLINPDGSAPRQLTTGLAPVSGFDVTLDGARVAFASGGAVRVMSTDGSSETVLTEEDRFEYAPRFSPDGTRLVVGRREADGTDAGWWLVPLDPTAGDEQQLLAQGAPPLGSTGLEGDGIDPTSGTTPWAGRAVWDESGERILLTTATGGVVLIDLAPDVDPEGEPFRADTGLVAGAAGAWSTDEERFLIVARGRDDTADALWAVGPDGVAERVGEGSGSVAVAPDGRLATLGGPEGGTVVLRVGPAGEGRPVASREGLVDRAPAFSPDGSTVVFGRVDADARTRSGGIWRVDWQGGEPSPLTTDGTYPRWLP